MNAKITTEDSVRNFKHNDRILSIHSFVIYFNYSTLFESLKYRISDIGGIKFPKLSK